MVQTLQGFLELLSVCSPTLSLPRAHDHRGLAAALAHEPSGVTLRGGLGSAGICTLAGLPRSTALVLAASVAEAGASMS